MEAEAQNKRLAQEDRDGSDDEDEEEKRIRFSGVKNKTQRQKIAEEIGTDLTCCIVLVLSVFCLCDVDFSLIVLRYRGE